MKEQTFLPLSTLGCHVFPGKNNIGSNLIKISPQAVLHNRESGKVSFFKSNYNLFIYWQFKVILCTSNPK